jgi:hypothetical protein
MANQLVTNKKEWQGYSSDLKPITGNGSTYHVIDTGEMYVCHDGVWERDLRLERALLTILNQ